MTDAEKIKKLKEILGGELCIKAYKTPITETEFDELFQKELSINGISSNLFAFIKIYEQIVNVLYEDGEEDET